MSKRRSGLMAAVCLVSLIVAGAAQAESLADALTMAYQTNPTLLSARSSQRSTDESYVAAKARLGPTASLTVGQSISADGNARTADSNPATFSVTLSQPLSTGGTLNRNLTNAELTVLSGRDSLRASEANLLSGVINAYVNLKLQNANLTLAQDSLTVSQKESDENDAKYAVGLITRTDVEQSRAALASAQTRLESAKNTVATARAQYAVLVGQNPGDLETAPNLPNVPSSFEEALEIAQQWSPSWRQTLYSDRQAEIALANAEHGVDPQVSLSASYGSAGNRVDVNGVRNFFDRDTASASVNVSVPLFTSGLNGSTIRNAREARYRSTLTVENARRTLNQTVQNQWNSLINARNTVVTTQASLDAQTLVTSGMREQVNQGLNTTFDLLQQEDGLRSAQQAVIQARANVYLAAVSLLQTIGRLEARYLIPDAVDYDPLDNFNRVKDKAFNSPYTPLVLAADKLFSPSLNAPKAGDEAPKVEVGQAAGEPALETMAPHPDAATQAADVLPEVPDDTTLNLDAPPAPAPSADQVLAAAAAAAAGPAIALPASPGLTPPATLGAPTAPPPGAVRVTPQAGAAAGAGRAGAIGPGGVGPAAGAGRGGGRGGAVPVVPPAGQ